jgi:hypothetical protein
MDEKNRPLKVVPPSKKDVAQEGPHLDPLDRFKGVVLNLTENALDCVNRISQQEMQKDSPSATLMEEYFFLHHCLDFIKRLCQGEKGSSTQTLWEEYFLLHESMHFE